MREMKDSGVEWIGEIPKDWELIQVKYLFKIGRGRVIAQTELTDTGTFPVYSSQTKDNGCLGYIETFDFDLDQLTWTTDGANAGTVFIRNGKHNCTNVCGTLQPMNNNLNLKYQKYALEHIAFYHKRADTNGFKIMNNEMAAIRTICPPLENQHRIADYLDRKCSKIDEIIEKEGQVIEKLKAYKLSVITEAVTKGLNPNVPMKDSGIKWIGEIPEDWRITKITRLLDYNHPYPIGDGDHGIIKTEDYQETGIPYIRVQNLGWGTPLKLQSVVYISEEKNKLIKNSTLCPGDILFAKTGGTIGKTAIVPYTIPKSNTTSHIGKITVQEKYNQRFIFYLLSSFVGYKQFWDIAGLKSTRPELTIDEIRKIKLIVPSTFSEQQTIADYLDNKCTQIDEIITKKQSTIEKLTAYKKSLIYEVVTGKKEA